MKHYELYKDEELVSMYRDGDARAVDEIMERYKNLVRKKANAMYIVGGDKDDLIQEGMIGLYKAVTTYDELKAASFATFASLCINGQLMNAVKASNAKKNTPLNSYVSFDTPANKSDDESDMKLVDTLVHDSEQNPEALYIDREVRETGSNTPYGRQRLYKNSRPARQDTQINRQRNTAFKKQDKNNCRLAINILD